MTDSALTLNPLKIFNWTSFRSALVSHRRTKELKNSPIPTSLQATQTSPTRSYLEACWMLQIAKKILWQHPSHQKNIWRPSGITHNYLQMSEDQAIHSHQEPSKDVRPSKAVWWPQSHMAPPRDSIRLSGSHFHSNSENEPKSSGARCWLLAYCLDDKM